MKLSRVNTQKKIIINKCQFKNKGRSYVQKATVKKSLSLILKLVKWVEFDNNFYLYK